VGLPPNPGVGRRVDSVFTFTRTPPPAVNDPSELENLTLPISSLWWKKPPPATRYGCTAGGVAPRRRTSNVMLPVTIKFWSDPGPFMKTISGPAATNLDRRCGTLRLGARRPRRSEYDKIRENYLFHRLLGTPPALEGH